MNRLRDLLLISLFAAILSVCAWLVIPGPVPVTLQTLGVFLSSALLGGKRGTAAVGVYLLLGAVGLPVFSGFTGGVGALLGPTGGYLAGFLLTALVMWGVTALWGRRLWSMGLSMALGLLVCYAFGTGWFLLAYARGQGAVSLLTVLSRCVFPFLLPDAAKLALALLLWRRLRRFVPA